MDQKKIDRILRWHKRRPSVCLRNEIISHYMYLVRAQAEHLSRHLPGSVEVDDLVSDGTFGLIEAIERFDPEKKIRFQTFAPRRIRGAMLDGLRSRDPISRTRRLAVRSLNLAASSLRAGTGVNPTPAEMARHMKVPIKKYHDMAQAARESVTCSLYFGRQPDGARTGQIAADSLPDKRYADPCEVLVSKLLRDEITTGLSRAERLVTVLYYYESMTMHEIGDVLDLSESRVSQMHSSILARLKARLPATELIG